MFGLVEVKEKEGRRRLEGGDEEGGGVRVGGGKGRVVGSGLNLEEGDREGEEEGCRGRC